MMEKSKTTETMYLGEFAKRCGVHKDTVRNYVERGVLRDTRNPINNYRIFTEKDVQRMQAFLRGVTIAEQRDE